ncbi:hypothetical protein V8G54_036835 [Vigna mungo]|uniref:Uncharacterized protein n=1 Tax=Vigna mungo TaxID=3915 RepID=A0AAQ3MHH3_VIGMU
MPVMTRNRIAPETATHKIHTKRAMFIGSLIHSTLIFLSEPQSSFLANMPLKRSLKRRELGEGTPCEIWSFSVASRLNLADADPNFNKLILLGIKPKVLRNFF